MADSPTESSGINTITASTATTYTLATTSSSIDDFYIGWWIKITSGANTG